MSFSEKPSRGADWHACDRDVLGFAVPCLVLNPSGLQLDGNSSFSLKVHVVKKLLLHVALSDAIGVLKQAVREC